MRKYEKVAIRKFIIPYYGTLFKYTQLFQVGFNYCFMYELIAL